MTVKETVEAQRRFFLSGKTRTKEFRTDALKRLKQAISRNEMLINKALEADLNKCPSESYLCETGIVYDEIGYHIRHLGKWMKNKKVPTPLAQFRSKSFVSPEPYGVVLIMAPWNYPLQLCLSPLIGAISAGNCAVIKPSAYAPETSKAVAKIVSEAFDPDHVTVIEGGREQNHALLEEKFDYIFFTGSVAVGKVVMKAASENLTPISLELGGKSPVIVDETADIPVSARRIAFGKILNAGQTCVAPDYAFVHESVKARFIEEYKKAVDKFFPENDYSDYPHIINEKHFDRLTGLMENEKIVFGGKTDKEKRLILPALLDDVALDAPVMQEEIFGPILPIIGYSSLDECINHIVSKPKPLAFYLFTKSKQTEKRILNTCSFGGGCINDTIIHLATHHMGFGGVGESGMGSYHGRFSFDTFSHQRAIVNKKLCPDIKIRYRPYSEKKNSVIKKLMK